MFETRPGRAARWLTGRFQPPNPGFFTAGRVAFDLPQHSIEVELRRIFDEILDLLRDNSLHPVKDVGVRE